MERLVTVSVMRERYGCSLPTARKYLRQCDPHMENPLAATESAVRQWETNRTVWRNERKRPKSTTERVIVPRRR